MNYYIEFGLLPDPEFTTSFLMNALFAKLHRVFVELNNRELGVSFPHARHAPIAIGDRLRIHGSDENLERLMAKKWLTGMHDHLQVESIEMIPKQTLHSKIRRIQPKSNVDRLRRRHMKRHNVTYEVAARRIPDTAEQHVSLPYLKIQSQSTGQHFCLFIKQDEPGEIAIGGEFNAYGLSLGATVPWF